MAVYSREFVFEFEDSDQVFFELPTPAHGLLDRLTVSKLGGALTEVQVRVYNRRGACVGGIDRFCRGGAIDSVADQAGKVRLVTAEPHKFLGGEKLLLKDTDTVLDRVVGTVTAVVDATTVDTDLTHTAVSAGYWQTAPKIYPLLPAEAYLVYSAANIPVAEFDLDREYENRDNQDEHARTRQTALYLQMNPNNSGTVVVAYTIKPTL